MIPVIHYKHMRAPFASEVALASAASAAAAGVALASEEVGLLGAGATFAALDRLVGTWDAKDGRSLREMVVSCGFMWF